MEFSEVIRKRRSVRGYLSDPVPPEKLDRILEAVRIAPSAANLQPVHFIVVKDPAVRGRLKEAYDKSWFSSAPVIIAGCVDLAKAWKRSDGFSTPDVDLAIAFDHLTLAAADEGLGTCWVCNFNESKAREILGIPEAIRLIAMTPLGFPDLNASLRPFVRKELKDILHHDKW